MTMHLAVALLNAGYSVATFDLDTRQRSLTRYLENRERWSIFSRLELKSPLHQCFTPCEADSAKERQHQDFTNLMADIKRVEQQVDFILIDTPGHDGYITRLCHSVADTLVTPLNDSYVDFDVIAQIDPASGKILAHSHYANTVREARRKRRTADNGLLDWVVVRNRMSQIKSRNTRAMDESLRELSGKLGFRIARGISERVIFRELFPIGMTALDEISLESCGIELSDSHIAAKQEVRALIGSLQLPIDELSKKRLDIRNAWIAGNKPGNVTRLTP